MSCCMSLLVSEAVKLTPRPTSTSRSEDTGVTTRGATVYSMVPLVGRTVDRVSLVVSSVLL